MVRYSRPSPHSPPPTQDVHLEHNRLKAKASSHGLVLEHDGSLAVSDSEGDDAQGDNMEQMLAEYEVELAAAREEVADKNDELAGLHHALSESMLESTEAARKHDAALKVPCSPPPPPPPPPPFPFHPLHTLCIVYVSLAIVSRRRNSELNSSKLLRHNVKLPSQHPWQTLARVVKLLLALSWRLTRSHELQTSKRSSSRVLNALRRWKRTTRN